MDDAVLSRRRAAQAALDRAGEATFQGVKRREWRARPEAARNLGRELSRRSEVGYWVVWPEGGSA